ncbi:hypothetical protein NYQ10_06345 [Flavobacterium johnsoniae]|uniref:SDH family Clp fold serine proteinase n=1 Tax=Flavobacterium johnsoniae TaxID=986 RepID=UPI0025AF1E21|nr:hypothetical protein [Flavobacterium johnsoniae]WJS96071.1 hypothetical protein NYQ10_06345 [Flavobacterium johnsoniae]
MSWKKERKKTPFDKAREKNKPAENSMTGNPSLPLSSQLLSKMEDGREFESLTKYQFASLNLKAEIQAGIKEIEDIRQRPAVCFMANTISVAGNTMIEDSDDLPFEEMISSIDSGINAIDIILETPGGLSTTVAKFVDKLRARFDHIGFIILNKAMSAGTMFVMSGDEIVMTGSSQIGPIDPQVRRMNGTFLPAQSILYLIEEVKKRGNDNIAKGKPIDWTDQFLINGIDRIEAGNAMIMSSKSIDMVENYLDKYKFKEWTTHKDGSPVTVVEKKERANEIAKLLCNHEKWKDHGYAIDRITAWEVCQLKITHSENISGMDRAMKRMWALMYYLFLNTQIQKVYVSSNYGIIRTFKTITK